MSLWLDVAISDMRKPGDNSAEFSAGYQPGSFAPNDAPPSGRRGANNTANQSSQWLRAQLSQGRYASPDAFNPAINPHYAEISWITNETVKTQPWPEVLIWNQIYLADPWRQNHLPGWINNTRVGSWDHQLWLKLKSTGQWVRWSFSDSISGHAIRPDFREELFDGSMTDVRTEAGTGYKSIRLVYDQYAPLAPEFPYWAFHGYSGGRKSIDGPDIADIVISQRSSLFVHDPYYADDRDYARFLLAIGADYYPPPGAPYLYPAVGTSRHKLVTAKWPNWQYHVCHSMTEPQIRASYPSFFVGLSEGTSAPPPDPEEPPPSTVSPPASPTVGNWFTLLDGTDANWQPLGVANTAPAIVRSPTRRAVMR
jgi:hypothetical protein